MRGRHSQEKYRVQSYYKLDDKALLVVVSQIDESTMTDEIIRCIRDRALALGIINDDGSVSENFKNEIEVAKEVIKQTEKTGNK